MHEAKRVWDGCRTAWPGLVGACLMVVAGAGSAEAWERQALGELAFPADLPAGAFATQDAWAGLTFDQPLALATPPGETDRIFVVEKTGRIQGVTNLAAPTKTVFLDLSGRVLTSGEQGLLGLAFHPRYAENGYFYVFYSHNLGGQRHQTVARFRVSAGNPAQADPTSEQRLLSQRDEASNHNGGDLHFGPDGYLYVALGDEGGGNDQYDNGRWIDRDFHAGILRLDVDGKPGSLAPNPHATVVEGAYRVPPDNPWVGATSFHGRALDPARVRTEFWAAGLRNPWRISFDPPTGRLFAGDVGQGAREEIDLIEGGEHYGWSYREGFLAFTQGPGGANPPAGFTARDPIWDYPRSQGNSVTGGLVYRGDRYAELFEAYLCADYGSGRIWALREGPSGWSATQIASDGGIVGFGRDPTNGDPLLADLAEGKIKRLVRSGGGGDATLPARLSLTGLFADLDTLAPAAGLVPYAPAVSFWSDHARKYRWFGVPRLADTFGFATAQGWSFPAGTVWVKHFDLELHRGEPASARRLETRIFLKTATGAYGVTYRWRPDGSDADLLPAEGLDEVFSITEADGSTRPQTWRYPSRGQCLTCHTSAAGFILGFGTAQLNAPLDYGDGQGPRNQVQALAQAGYFDRALPSPATWPTLARANDETQSLEFRFRSYLEVNCAQCHRPGGPALDHWDARLSVPTDDAGLIDGALVSDGGSPTRRVLVAGSEIDSMLLQRLLGAAGPRMPPVGSNELDPDGIALVRAFLHQALPSRQSQAQWTAARFPDPGAPAADPSADPDGDGTPNRFEFLAGTDPMNPASAWRPEVTADGMTAFLRFAQPPNRAALVETSLDLRTWVPWDHPANVPSFPADAREREFSLPLPTDHARFFRVQLREP